MSMAQDLRVRAEYGGKSDMILTEARAAGAFALDEERAKRLLTELGVSVPKGVRLTAAEPAARAVQVLTPPFVLKALAHEALHKTDIGAIRLRLTTAEEVEAAQAEIAAAVVKSGGQLAGFLLEEMVSPGTEIVIGGTIDPQLGPMIMVGAGGIFAEILDDVSFRLCPIGRHDAAQMIEELRILPVLQGARGRQGADIEAIIAALLAFGSSEGFFTMKSDEVSEFDLNPLIASPDGLVAVDARFVLSGTGG